MESRVFTVGYANRSVEEFVAVLRDNSVNAVADIRSVPFSGSNPEFNHDSLKRTLGSSGIAYAFLGKELGARTPNTDCYVSGRVQYDRLATTPTFQLGLGRIEKGISSHRIALMCAEKEPFDCHRCILVGRHLCERGIRVSHILEGGQTEEHSATIGRLIQYLRISDAYASQSEEDNISMAYRIQGERIAFKVEEDEIEQPLLWG